MYLFEVHITGNEQIHNRGFKTITIENLSKEGNVISVDHMTSFVLRYPNYADCKSYVDKVVDFLSDCGIVRVKIECPYDENYVWLSKYIESHFPVEMGSGYPTSRNLKNGKLLGTARMLNNANSFNYDFGELCESFMAEHEYKEIELCLHDSNRFHDSNWMASYA